MLPKTTLGKAMLKKLKVYAGSEHLILLKLKDNSNGKKYTQLEEEKQQLQKFG